MRITVRQLPVRGLACPHRHLSLIGDGQQTIYPGGYSLAEAGISVAGRGVVLATNYRNTREIAGFAASIVEGDEFVDLEGGPGRADAAAEVIRTGPSPALHTFDSLAALRTASIDGIELESYTGLTAPLVKVGTIKRAKGLEFKQVLLTRVDGSLLAPVPEGLDDGAREARETARRELYVGMTRARDGLWVGSTR